MSVVDGNKRRKKTADKSIIDFIKLNILYNFGKFKNIYSRFILENVLVQVEFRRKERKDI